MKRLAEYMGWKPEHLSGRCGGILRSGHPDGLQRDHPVEIEPAVRTAAQKRASRPGGKRLDTVMWAASGSEAIQKALWACLHRHHESRHHPRHAYGFHGKKGLAGAVTGSETDADRDPRVKFISFPEEEVDDISQVWTNRSISSPYRAELETLWQEYGERINCLITEPYLGGGGSYHPHAEYLQLLQNFCREHDILFILDEVQANFGRTGKMYAFEKYGIEPDLVCLGKGLGNGVPVVCGGGPRRRDGQPEIRRSLRHLECEPALLCGGAGHAGRV